MLDNKPSQPLKFKAENWVERSDDSRGMYNTNSQIKFKNSILKSVLCDYSDAYILVKRTITITTKGNDTEARQAGKIGKEVTFKNCVPFTVCISETYNTQVDNAKDLDVVTPTYNLIGYDEIYSKISGNLIIMSLIII